jgi:hypothetical protein
MLSKLSSILLEITLCLNPLLLKKPKLSHQKNLNKQLQRLSQDPTTTKNLEARIKTWETALTTEQLLVALMIPRTRLITSKLRKESLRKLTKRLLKKRNKNSLLANPK